MKWLPRNAIVFRYDNDVEVITRMTTCDITDGFTSHSTVCGNWKCARQGAKFIDLYMRHSASMSYKAITLLDEFEHYNKYTFGLNSLEDSNESAYAINIRSIFGQWYQLYFRYTF